VRETFGWCNSVSAGVTACRRTRCSARSQGVLAGRNSPNAKFHTTQSSNLISGRELSGAWCGGEVLPPHAQWRPGFRQHNSWVTCGSWMQLAGGRDMAESFSVGSVGGQENELKKACRVIGRLLASQRGASRDFGCTRASAPLM
jgi:hypothetical protein